MKMGLWPNMNWALRVQIKPGFEGKYEIGLKGPSEMSFEGQKNQAQKG